MSERCLLLIGNRAGLVCGGPLNLADSRASSGQRASRWTRRARRFPTRGRKTLMRAIAAPTIARELTLQYAVLMLTTERRSELSPWLALSSSSTNFPTFSSGLDLVAAEECLMIAVAPGGEGGWKDELFGL